MSSRSATKPASCGLLMMILGPVMYVLALGSVERARRPMIGELI
jgi:hypothetical protein